MAKKISSVQIDRTSSVTVRKEGSTSFTRIELLSSFTLTELGLMSKLGVLMRDLIGEVMHYHIDSPVVRRYSWVVDAENNSDFRAFANLQYGEFEKVNKKIARQPANVVAVQEWLHGLPAPQKYLIATYLDMESAGWQVVPTDEFFVNFRSSVLLKILESFDRHCGKFEEYSRHADIHAKWREQRSTAERAQEAERHVAALKRLGYTVALSETK